MAWMETMMAALFGDGGALGYLRLSKNTPSAASPVDPAAFLDNSSTEVNIDVPEVTLRELKKSTRSFSEKTLIGEGRYAKVYKASMPGGTTVAAKRVGTPSRDRWKASDAAFLLRQVSLASRLRHENLVQLLGYNMNADLRVLLYEFAPLGTLHDALHGPRGEPAQGPSVGASRVSPVMATLSWAQRVPIALDAAKGLAYLHEAGLMHHDVRSTNVLLFQGFRAKIADYDLFKQLPEKDVEINYMVQVTRAAVGYYAPEWCMTGRVTQKSDVFSFGVVLLELLTGNKADDYQLKSVVHSRASVRFDPKLGKQYSRTEARKLAIVALECLKPVPTSRPSMATVVTAIQLCVADGERCSG